VAKVLNDTIGIERGLMTTIHAYTNDQKILDQIHPDLRRARAAGMSMIPTTTGAARAVGEVLPELKGKLDGSAVRVPVPDGSLIDLTFTPSRDTSVEEVNGVLKAAAESGPLKGILVYSEDPLVSVDIVHTAQSSTIDSLETAVLEGKLVRVVSWYDNEWGFSNRMVDTAAAMAKLG
jgi:glyceraldehyde 3-phosphate dehydrogenase